MSIENSGAPAAESPTAENLTENEGATAPEGSTAAASSPADEEDAKPVDLLSVVKNAVQKEETTEAGSSAAEGVDGTKPGEAEPKPEEGKVEGEAEAEADKKLPFHEHPRWKEVVAERNELREDAGRFREISGFMDQHGLTGDEVAEGFDIMAKLKSGKPETLAEARDYFASRLAFLDDALGNTLPEDLRERVETGEMSEEAAQELARSKAAAKIAETQLTTREAAETEGRDRAARQATATAMATAVDDWETRQKVADPDYPKKAELVEVTCRAIVQRDPAQAPKSAEQAVALAEAALKEVNAKLRLAVPAPKPIRPTPSGSSAAIVAEPKNLREAIAAAANSGR